MSRMIWFEWKRIWKSRLTQLAVAGSIVFFIFCTWSNIRLIQETTADGDVVTGLEAVEVRKEQLKKVTLDQEKVDTLMEEYLDYTQDPDTSSDNRDFYYLSEEAYLKWYLPNDYLLRPIEGAYMGEDQPDASMKEIFEQNMGTDFYEAGSERIGENLTRYVRSGYLTEAEADWWNDKSGEPAEYTGGYSKAWEDLLNSISWILLVMMVVCIGIAPMFAGEYQTKCDSLLLSMRYGKSRLILAKLAAAMLFATAVYWGITLLYSGLHLLVLGVEGWDLPVQTLYRDVTIPYHLSALGAYALALAMGYIMTLGLAGLVLFVSSLLKNPYGVIITAFLYLCVPVFLTLGRGGYAWKHFLGLLPEKISEFGFDSYMVYSAGPLTVTWPVAAMAVNGACAVILSIAVYLIFRRHQVNR